MQIIFAIYHRFPERVRPAYPGDVDRVAADGVKKVTLELGPLGQMKFEGAAAIKTREDGETFFALRVRTRVELGIAVLGIKAGALLEVNTGSQDYTPLQLPGDRGSDLVRGQRAKVALLPFRVARQLGRVHLDALDAQLLGEAHLLLRQLVELPDPDPNTLRHPTSPIP